MRPLTIFYILLGYIFLQFCWWAVLLIQLQSKWIMVAGEGIVFLSLLTFGAFRLKKAITEELALNKQQKNFLLSVTHELKSPLASIKLSLQTILKRDLNKEQSNTLLQNSLQDIERLDDLVGNMLMATRIENRSYSFPKEKFNLSETVEHAVKHINNNLQGKRIIEESVQKNIQIDGDHFALLSMINNLIENAIKYSSEESKVLVNLKQEQEQIILSVTDTGLGIPETERLKIFDKFYRIGNENTRKTKGTGLGLFIVKQVIDNHQGSIIIKNNKPQGSIFEVIFKQA